MARRLWAVLLVCGSAASCDGIGRAVVGPIVPDGMATSMCNVMASCVPPPMERTLVDVPDVWDATVLGCTGLAEATACGLETMQSNSRECVEPHAMDGDALTGLATVCDLLVLDLRGREAPLVIKGPTVTSARFALFADTSVTVVLDGASVDHSLIELHGPIQMRFENHSVVYGVRIESDSPDSSIALRESDATALVITEGGGTFPGRVEIVRSEVRESKLALAELVVESSVIDDTSLRADSFRAGDFESHALTLAVGTGEITSAHLTGLALIACDAMLLSGVKSKDASIHGCTSGALRVYDSDLLSGFVDGQVDSKESNFSLTTFGTRAPTRLDMRGGTLEGSALCVHVTATTLSKTHPTCNACEGTDLSNGDSFCAVGGLDTPSTPEDGAVTQNTNSNPSCPTLDRLPGCSTPPTDERPF